jgi:hypothetical protein
VCEEDEIDVFFPPPTLLFKIEIKMLGQAFDPPFNPLVCGMCVTQSVVITPAYIKLFFN